MQSDVYKISCFNVETLKKVKLPFFLVSNLFYSNKLSFTLYKNSLAY